MKNILDTAVIFQEWAKHDKLFSLSGAILRDEEN